MTPQKAEQPAADACNDRGMALARTGRLREAIAEYTRALTTDPNHAQAHNNIGNVYRQLGRFSDAIHHYDQSLQIMRLAGSPSMAEVWYNKSRTKTFTPDDPDIQTLLELDRQPWAVDKGVFINFALSEAMDDCGEYERAFAYMQKGNTLKRMLIQYDEKQIEDVFRRITTVFSADMLNRHSGGGDESDVPIFILGMPRSGSTLVEQILAAHPMVHTAGETTAFEQTVQAVLGTFGQYPECMHYTDDAVLRRIGRIYASCQTEAAGDKLRCINKLPFNFVNIGLIRMVLPNARIIHTVREPADTCLSCYANLFTNGMPFSYELGELGRYYRLYAGMMEYWERHLPGAVLNVSYEAVVGDLEGQAKRLVSWCGLPWDEACLDFQHSGQAIRTASAWQVRQPLHQRSTGRWKHYEKWLGPLLKELK